MNQWEILDIEPTIEISVIKKTYAKKLKIYHPEEDPQGFQKLREAYVKALEYAKNYEYDNKHNNIDDEDEHEDEHYKQEVENGFYVQYNKKSELVGINNNEYVDIQKDQLIDKFLSKASILYNSFFDRIVLKNWIDLFNSDIMWELYLKQAISWELWNYLSEHYYIPRDVWIFLNDIFSWVENGNYLYNGYPQMFMNYVNLQLGEDRVPSYLYFNKNIDINYDEYLSYRETAFLALINNDLNKAFQFLRETESLYREDPNMFCLKGEYHYRNGDYSMGDTEFQNAIELRPDDYQILFYKAQLMYELGLYQEAFQLFKSILEKKDVQEVYLFIEHRAFKTKMLWEASQLCVDLLILDPNNSRAEINLNKIIEYYEKTNTYPGYKNISKIYGALGDKYKKRKYKKKSIKTFLYAIMLICPWFLFSLFMLGAIIFAQPYLLLLSLITFVIIIISGILCRD